MVTTWQGCNVFLTGHTGFKGSWLALWLHRLGAQVSGYALAPPTTPSLFAAADVVSALAHHTVGDVRSLPSLTAAMQTAEPQVVFHLAAQPLVREGYADPVLTYGSNVMGTVHLLEAVRACPSVQAAVVVTSDKCYATIDRLKGHREEDRLGGHDPYASSKACAELVTASYRASYWPSSSSPAVATARAGNILGGGDWAKDRLVPDVIRAQTRSMPLTIRSPEAIRPWQFVLDALWGYLLLAEGLLKEGRTFAEGWNFGPGAEAMQPVRTIVEHLHTDWPLETGVAMGTTDGPHERAVLRLNSTKARQRLDWAPVLSFTETLEWTTAWYRRYVEDHDMAAITRKQIARFEERL